MINLRPFNKLHFFHKNIAKILVGDFPVGKTFRAAQLGLFSILILVSTNIGYLNVYDLLSRPMQEDDFRYSLVPMDGIYSTQDEDPSGQPTKQHTASLNEKLLKSTTNWSEPVLLFEEDGTGEIHAPSIISDSYGNVHVFWSVISGGEGELDLIYYMARDAMGWTTPVDVVARTIARAATAAISQDDFIYLIWNGSGGISYSRAPLQGAEFVKNWSEPVLITDASIRAGIDISPSGNVYLAYPGVRNTGVFLQFLEPNNQNWSSPRMISSTSMINTSSDYVQMKVSNNGTMHVVWTEFLLPDGWPPTGVFYSQSIDGGNTWSAPALLGGDRMDQINILLLDDNNIHVAWNGMVGLGGRYHRWSSDAGVTWSETSEIIRAGLGGTEGRPHILADQSGTVHMLTTYEGCAWYTYLENQRWVTPICISGEKARASDYIEEPAMTLSEGNILHAVFWDDRKRLWYTTKVTDAAWIAPKPMDNELLQPSPTPIDTQVATAVAKPTSWLVDQQLDTPSKYQFTTGQILIMSLSPAILLIILVAVSRFYKKIR